MENQNNPQNSSKTDQLLLEQNNLLKEILVLLKHHEQKEFRHNLVSFISHAIPYIAIIIIGYYFYTVLQGYLDALNHNISILKDSYLNLQETFMKLIPDFSGIGTKLQDTWQNVKNVF